MDTRISQFLNFLAVEKNASANTIAAYKNDLNQFLTHVKLPVNDSGYDWESVNGTTIVDYVTNLRDRGYKDATVARKVAAVKSFFGFLARGEARLRRPDREPEVAPGRQDPAARAHRRRSR